MERLTITTVGEELLDDPGADPARVTESLRNVARANRWFGGTAAVLYGLRQLLRGVPSGATLSFLDLGTGTGDVPVVACKWAAARRVALRPIAIERSRVAARLARARGIPCVVACAGAPPLRDKSVDLVLTSQLVHHLAAPSAIRLLQACDRLARHGVIVADIRRTRLAPLAFWCGARALRFDATTLADGITSIRRGYTVAELRALLASAGLTARVERRPGYRLVATWRPV